jgi:hypothetical protein
VYWREKLAALKTGADSIGQNMLCDLEYEIRNRGSFHMLFPDKDGRYDQFFGNANTATEEATKWLNDLAGFWIALRSAIRRGSATR